MRIGRQLCLMSLTLAVALVAGRPREAAAGDVWVCSGSSASVSVSVYPLYSSNTRVNFCNLAPNSRYRVTVQKPCYWPTASIWWSWLNLTTWTTYGSGQSQSREFTTSPGGSYYLVIRGVDPCCTCNYKVTLSPISSPSFQPLRSEGAPQASAAEASGDAGMTWGRLKLIYR